MPGPPPMPHTSYYVRIKSIQKPGTAEMSNCGKVMLMPFEVVISTVVLVVVHP